MNPNPRTLSLIKVFVFAICLLPLARLGWGVWQDALGANPIEFVIRSLGTWALSFLLITLSVTPLRKFSGWTWLARLRRMLGLYAFFYALLHLSTYLWVDQFFDWSAIAKDILKRPFITIGMSTFILLVPLAVTSTNAMVKRLGGRRWQQLHRSIYVIAVLAVTHYWWMVKLDTRQPAIYAAVLALLLGMRVLWRYQEMRRQQAGAYAPKRARIIPIIVKR
jgi:sulfoxide reductase heme-binding subunit YedZ